MKLYERIEFLRSKDPNITVTFNSEQTSISVLHGKLSTPLQLEKLRKTPFRYARKFIKENKMLFGNINESSELGNERAITDQRGATHVIFCQKYGDAVVFGAILSAHYGTEGTLYLIKSNLATAIDVPKKSKITAEHAVKIANKHAGPSFVSFEGRKPVLTVVDAQTIHQENGLQKYYLTWQLGLIASKDSVQSGWIYFVNALDGKVLSRYPSTRTGEGIGHYSRGTILNSEAFEATFRLRDTLTSSSWPVSNKPLVHTYDDGGRPNFGESPRDYSEDDDDNWNRDDQGPEVDIHRYQGYILSHYYLTHGHVGWNGLGSDVAGHAHCNRADASPWDPGAAFDIQTHRMYFSDGDDLHYDCMCPLDVVAHEFAHGVNQDFNVLQLYDGETGALDEALSDLFGYFIALEYPEEVPQPWIHGQLCRLDGTRGRNMADPSRDENGNVGYEAINEGTMWMSFRKGFFPDHYSIRYRGADDFSGVHYNCPIITHAVFLMINGGTHRLSGVNVTGIGIAPVEQMLYEVISTGLVNNTSKFADFRFAFILACKTLYPENVGYLATVKTAFHAVGIGPDLYIRDTISDEGSEARSASCWSPDIIVRNDLADADTLARIADVSDSNIFQNPSSSSDNYVYFRLFNRGAAPASGTFRLFLIPTSAFSRPASWTEVGHYDFPEIPPNGGVWVPKAATDCIILPATLLKSLGTKQFCFIGVIESLYDPAPNRMLITTMQEFRGFIGKSNNCAWRNIYTVDFDRFRRVFATLPDYWPVPWQLSKENVLRINDFGQGIEQRCLEIDTRDMPKGTRIVLLTPVTNSMGLKAFEARPQQASTRGFKIAGILRDLPIAPAQILRIPLSALSQDVGFDEAAIRKMPDQELQRCRPLGIAYGKVVRLTGFQLAKGESLDIRFIVKFEKNAEIREFSFAFRELFEGDKIGQVNYVFRVRNTSRRIKKRPS